MRKVCLCTNWIHQWGGTLSGAAWQWCHEQSCHVSCVWCNDMQMLPSEFWDTREPVTDDREEHICVISQGTLKINFDSYLEVWIYNSEQKQSSVKVTLLLPDVVKLRAELLVRWDSDSLLTAIGPFPPALLLSPVSRGMWQKKVNWKVESWEKWNTSWQTSAVHCDHWHNSKPRSLLHFNKIC